MIFAVVTAHKRHNIKINKGNVPFLFKRMADFDNLKIFKLNRIKYQELIEDAIAYVKKTYKASN